MARIMKCRCPHCRQIFETEKVSSCPACGKALRNPSRWKAPKPDGGRRSPGRAGNTQHLRQPVWFLFIGRPRFMIWVLGGCILVVGFLLTLDINTGIPYRPPPKVIQTRKELKVIRTALEWFRVHCKRYPTSEEGLKALVRNPGVPGWQGYYLQQLPPDLWGRSFLYSSSNDTVRLASAGPDGVDGTPDDVAAPEPDYKALMKRLSLDKKK